MLWKQLDFVEVVPSTLKKEAGSRSKLESICLFEMPEVEAFFIKLGVEMWKQLNFCGSRSTLKKEAGSGSKNILLVLLPHPWFHIQNKVKVL